MDAQEFKNKITEFGLNNINSESVVVVESGDITLGSNSKSVLEPNEICIGETIWEFSRNFNDTAIECLLPQLNRMIELSKIENLLEL